MVHFFTKIIAELDKLLKRFKFGPSYCLSVVGSSYPCASYNQYLTYFDSLSDDVGDQLCERVLGVLYEIWLVSCVKCFPSPSLWKTFR